MDEDNESLKHEYLDKDFFNALITGGELVRDMLMWMIDPDGLIQIGQMKNGKLSLIYVGLNSNFIRNKKVYYGLMKMRGIYKKYFL